METRPSHLAYSIDGVEAVDYFIRHEKLEEGVAEVLNHLGLSKNVGELQKFKAGTRPQPDHLKALTDYFDSQGIEHVQKVNRWEIERFGYSIGESR